MRDVSESSEVLLLDVPGSYSEKSQRDLDVGLNILVTDPLLKGIQIFFQFPPEISPVPHLDTDRVFL